MKKSDNKVRQSGLKIMASLIVLLVSLSYIMIIASINGTLGMVLASGVTLAGASAVAKALFDFFNIGVAINFPYWALITITVVCGVLRGLLRYIEQYSNHFIAFKLLAVLRDKVFKALRRLAPAKLEGKKKGSIISMITSDVETLEVFYAHTLSPICIAILYSLITFLFVGFVSSFILASVALFAYLVIGVILPLLFSKLLKKPGVEYRNTFSSFNAYFLDSIKGVKEIVMNNATDERIKEVEKRDDLLLKETAKIKKYTSLSSAITEMMVTFFILVSLATGILLSLYKALEINLMLIGVVAIFGSFGPVIALSALPSNLNQTFASGDRVLKLLNEKPLVNEIKNGKDFEFDNLSVTHLNFSYLKDESVLNDINLNVKKGDIIGIKGDSGSGKSTLLKLLLRFYEVDDEMIKYNSISINNINSSSLKDNVTMVSQSTYLFDDTILNNLKIAKSDATEEEIYEACKKASIHDFIMSLPEKYNSRVGQLGEAISAGEKQRIGLARAFLRNSSLILLDEPTSNVDSINEGIILSSLKAYSKDKTIILVSHRESTMSICSSVYKMEKGKLIKE